MSTQNGTSYAGKIEGSTTTQLTTKRRSGFGATREERWGGCRDACLKDAVGDAQCIIELKNRRKPRAEKLADTIALSAQSRFVNSRFHDISGEQTDALKVGTKTVSIVSNWSFSAKR